MRIAISKSIEGGGGVDHYTTDPDVQGGYMRGYTILLTGLRIDFHGTDYRLYPWTSISFYDLFVN